MKINVVFPMAGDGTRFGGKQFKPFIDGTEKLFIELAKEPFDRYKELYSIEFYFIYRQDQEDEFNVSKKLKELFPNDVLHFCILSNKTSGPAETLAEAVRIYALSGSAFVCDCDHAINVQPMTTYIETMSMPDILVPLLGIKENEQANFGKVKLDKNNSVLGFYEKEIVPFSSEYSVKGLVGCYLFKDVCHILRYPIVINISDLLPEYIKTHTVDFVDILEAGLFGTPESLIQYRFNLAKKMTFFVDIDGTLVYLPKHVSYDSADSTLLPGALEKLTEWKQKGHTIVLTTGRVTARREKLITLLKDLKVPYDQLVTNLRPGPRILINDKKPYSEIHQMAKAIQIRRNQGIAHIELQETPTILEKLKGGSFANVYLINKNDKLIVRKYIEKTLDNKVHVDTLRRQYDDLQRFSYYSPNITPKMLASGENENELYYDMEYLENHKELSQFSKDIEEKVIRRVLEKLNEDIYCYSKNINGQKWMQEFLEEKILSKYAYIESLGEIFNTILNSPEHLINNRRCLGIRKYFGDGSSIPLSLCPESVSPIHGDLTLENILYDIELDNYRLIDTSGSRYVDAKEMDTAKLLQSLLAKYETWDKRTDILDYHSISNINLPHDVINISEENYSFVFSSFTDKHAFQKSVYMLACYFIRMTPFLIKKSKQHAIFGLMLATYYLSFT
jgi:hypothetical protein